MFQTFKLFGIYSKKRKDFGTSCSFKSCFLGKTSFDEEETKAETREPINCNGPLIIFAMFLHVLHFSLFYFVIKNVERFVCCVLFSLSSQFTTIL